MIKVALRKTLNLPVGKLIGHVQQSSMEKCLFLEALIETEVINRLYFLIKKLANKAVHFRSVRLSTVN